MKRNILISVLMAMAGLAGTAGAGEEPAAGPPAYYTFQVMTLPAQYRANAERLLKELQAKGYPAYLLEVGDIPGTELYKIRVGRFSKAVDARAAAERFSEQEGRKVLVLRSQIPNWLPEGAAMPAATERVTPASGRSAEASAAAPQGPIKVAEPTGKPEAGEAKTSAIGTAAPADHTTPQPAPTAAEKGDPDFSPRAPGEVDGTIRRGSAETRLPVAAPVGTPTAEEQAPGSRPEDLPWPVSVSRIFWYRAADNTLHVTNVPLPAPDPARLERVSVFPVRYESAGDGPGTLVLEVDGERMEVVLAGVLISAPRDRESAFYERRLREVPLRLDYETEWKAGARAGRLSWRDGTSLNLELVRLGIAVCASEGLGPEEQVACRAAEEEAGRLKKN